MWFNSCLNATVQILTVRTMWLVSIGCKRRLSSFLCYSLPLLFLVIVALSDGHPTRHNRWHNRRQRSTLPVNKLENNTLCQYKTSVNVVEGRIPRSILHVTCQDVGCRCPHVDEGTWTCTQLYTNMTVVINGHEKHIEKIPYACVCASPSGTEVGSSTVKQDRRVT